MQTAGYYGWVEYKPAKNKTLSYTITTTNGKLNIDYALLENMVYYLQEAVAPDGYDIDTTDVCHLRRRYLQPAQGVPAKRSPMCAAGTTSSAADLGYKGAIEGGKTLTVQLHQQKDRHP